MLSSLLIEQMAATIADLFAGIKPILERLSLLVSRNAPWSNSHMMNFRRTLSAVCVSLFLLALIAPSNAFAYGIDDLVGPEWRIGIFSFLVFGMVLYAFAVVLYMRKGSSKLKRGEFIMLATILVGVGLGLLVSIIQLLEGYLI